MAKIVFQKSGLSDLTLERGRIFPVSSPIQVNQERYLTESLNAKVVVYSPSASFMEFKLAGISKDNFDGATNGLKTWFESSQVNWSENSFTLLDEDNVEHTVRLWQDELNVEEISPNRYQVTLLFKEE